MTTQEPEYPEPGWYNDKTGEWDLPAPELPGEDGEDGNEDG